VKGIKALRTPKPKEEAPESKKELAPLNGEGIDRAFDIFLILQTLIFATLFQYLTWLGKPDDLLKVTKVTRVFFIPILIITLLWMVGYLIEPSRLRIFVKTIAWYWSYLSFFIQILFIGTILFWDVLSPEISFVFVIMACVLTMIFGVFMQLKFQKVYGGAYSPKIMILSTIVSIASALIFVAIVLQTT
jgi:hypothetical protein